MTTNDIKTTVPIAATRAAKPRRQTKKDQLIAMLCSRWGSDIGRISEVLGWQVHTTRAALSGLRKAGFQLAVDKPAGGGPSSYRMTARPSVEIRTKPVGTDNAG